MVALDTDYFLNQVKLYGAIPGGRYTDAELLDVAADAMLSRVVPLIISLKEEYYVQYEDQDIIANQTGYLIPHRAMGLSLREIKRVKDNLIIDLPRMSPEEIETMAVGTPTKFYLQGHDVKLYPTPDVTIGSLRLSYFRTPSRPVLLSECAQIIGIDVGTGIVTATSPTSWTALLSYDLISRRNGHRCLAVDLIPVSLSTTNITFNIADLPSTLVVGDYIALAGEAPFFQVPDNCFDLIVRITVAEILESMGDQAGTAMMVQKADKIQANVVSLLTNRVQGAMKTSSISLI